MLELTNWLVNAFNGEWLKIANAKPNEWKEIKEKERKEKRATVPDYNAFMV